MVLPDQVIFLAMLICNIALLLFDSATWYLNGKTFPGAYTLNMICTVAYYLLTPLISVLYCDYCDVKMRVAPDKRRTLSWLYNIPLLINTVLAFLSVRGGYIFRLSADNSYQRGSMLWFSFLISYILLFVVFVRLLAFQKNGRVGGSFSFLQPTVYDVRSLLFFPFAPLISGVVLIFNNQITVVWLATVLSLLIIFINIQNVEIFTDALTGLYNRRQADIYLWNMVQESAKHPNLSLTIMDINLFKHINDRYGHLAGDNALKATASVLRSICGETIFCSRYGGDEFLLIAVDRNEAEIKTWIEKINIALADYSNMNQMIQPISVSAGIALWSEGFAGVDSFFRTADERLYENKAKLKRRRGD